MYSTLYTKSNQVVAITDSLAVDTLLRFHSINFSVKICVGLLFKQQSMKYPAGILTNKNDKTVFAKSLTKRFFHEFFIV